MKLVISIGGSILAPDGADYEYIKKFSSVIREITKNNKNKIGIVVGGGKVARKYIESARNFGANEFFSDLIGINATHLNARILISALSDISNPEPCLTIMDAEQEMKNNNVVIMGGTHPGHTTDCVAAMLAEYINADIFVVATSADYVYTKDPRKYPDARKLEKLSFDDLIKISGQVEMGAGSSTVVDLVAANIMKRSKIRTYVLHAADVENLKKALTGGNFAGSVVGD
jgi:uridylate kinase